MSAIKEWINKVIYSKSFYYIAFLLIMTVAVYNLFHRLGDFSVRQWDEAIYGTNAYEMLVNHNYIVSTYDNQTDFFSSKPPLGMWFIALAYKMFGYNLFALRFFSALFCLLTIVLVGFIVKIKAGSIPSLFTMLILTTTPPFIYMHSGRTGDFDSVFTFFMTASIVCMMLIERGKIYLYLSSFSLALSFLVKSFAAGQVVIILVIYLILSKKYKLFRWSQYLTSFCFAVVPVLLWVIARFSYDGIQYFKYIILTDLIGRSTTTIYIHKGGWLYYWEQISKLNVYWSFYAVALLILSFGKGLSTINNKLKLMAFIWATVTFIIFSTAGTKIVWYINPIYPSIAIILGLISYQVFKQYQIFGKVIIIALMVLVSVSSERNIYLFLREGHSSTEQMLEQVNSNSQTIYALNWQYHHYYYAKVIKGLTPKKMKTIQDFMLNATNGDMLMLDKNEENMKFIEDTKLPILSQNDEYMILSKP